MSVRMQQTEKRLEMLDQRLHNLDSVVTALEERVMRRAVSFEVVCPKCGSIVQVTLTGNARLSSEV